METYSAIEFAKQRMREIGKKPEQYHIEPVYISGTYPERSTKKITIMAFNSYYYLINEKECYGLEIISDTGYFNSDDPTNNTIQEYTGVIEINALPEKNWSIEDPEGRYSGIIPLEFIRVIFH